MNTTAPQSALREWRDHMTTPVRAAALLGAAVVLTLMGPFNTDDAMRALPRLAYWICVVGISYSIGYVGKVIADRLTMGTASQGVRYKIPNALIAATITSIGVLATIHLLNGLAIGYWASGVELAIIAGNVFVISSIITLVFHVADHTNANDSATPPPLLDRIAFDKRGPLVSLTVEDHYVRIRTIKGEDLVLIRLADAIREVGETGGIQVHRSHWIATAHVKTATRKGDGAVLSMSHGPDIPVSRANVSKLKEAGLLPR